MKNQIVSIIIPTYKNRGGLTLSIDSALKQTYPNIEIIVIDDNSPKSLERNTTEKLMEKYRDNEQVHYIRHEVNKNGAAARNTGIKAAKGEFIAFLDDDDEFLPEKIAKQVQFMNAHQEFDAVYNYSYVNDKEEMITPYEGNASIPLLMCRTKMFTPALMFRKSALDDIGGFNEDFRRHQDYELLLKFFDHGYVIGCLKEYLTSVHSLGGNKPTPMVMMDVKKKYFEAFDGLLTKLEANNPGIKNKIMAVNYESIFESCLSHHDFSLALKILSKYLLSEPVAFIGQFFYSNKLRLKRKINRR